LPESGALMLIFLQIRFLRFPARVKRDSRAMKDSPEDHAMKPRERRETGAQDLFRSRLDQIIDMKHELVRLAQTISWRFIEETCGAVYSDGPVCADGNGLAVADRGCAPTLDGAKREFKAAFHLWARWATGEVSASRIARWYAARPEKGASKWDGVP
jgi:hypothetical protein